MRDITRAYYGTAGDLPVPGDYDGSGLSEIAIFRPSSGLWAVQDTTRVYYGTTGDTPVPGLYQWYGTGNAVGSCRTQPAIFRSSTGL